MATKYIVDNLPGQTINDQQLQPYKVYTALLTQSGGNDPQTMSSGSVTVGVTYQLGGYLPTGSWDFSNVGGPVYPDTYTFVATASEEPNSWVGVEGLNYNTGAPVATVLENTIGNIWFTYNNAGTYNIYSDSLFLIGKTITFTTTSSRPSDPYWITTQIGNSEEIYLFQFDATGSYYNNLQSTSLEIRVYN